MNEEKQIFEETQAKQAKLVKKMLLGTFCGSGAAFVIVAVVLFILGAAREMPVVFLVMGLFFAALGVVLYFVIPVKYDYDKYKARVDKYGIMNVYEMNAKIIALEKRIEALEEKDENKLN